MLNPSTADATLDDATIRKCIGFSRLWGMGGLVVVNLFAYRSTDPDALYQSESGDVVGIENDATISKWAKLAAIRVAAWGAHGEYNPGRARTVRRMLGEAGRVDCLGTTLKGHPKHPLYVPYSDTLTEWKGYV